MQDYKSGIRKQKIEGKKIIKLKSHIYSFDNVSESRDEFLAATGLTVESFNNLLKFLNPGKDSCNIKFYDTLSRLSQSFDDIDQVQGQVQSQNCNLKISCSCLCI